MRMLDFLPNSNLGGIVSLDEPGLVLVLFVEVVLLLLLELSHVFLISFSQFMTTVYSLLVTLEFLELVQRLLK
jgi:hypothetical protein